MTYVISADGGSIKCLRCERTSYSLGDVANLYCGACGYHRDSFTPDSVFGAPIPFRGPSPPRSTETLHERCLGCGAMDEELEDPTCVSYGVLHSTVSVDEHGQLLPVPARLDESEADGVG